VRTRCIALAGIVALALGLVGCSSSEYDNSVKVAVIATTSGPLAKFGADTLAAIRFAADEKNAAGGVNGVPIELVIVDTDGTPARSLAAVRKAVTEEGATFITGVLSSPEQIAVQRLLQSFGAVSMAYVSDDVLHEEMCNPNAFLVSQSASMSVLATVDGLTPAQLSGRWAISAEDVSSGHTAVELIKAAVEEAGGTVVAEEFSPLGTTDFGPQISKIKASGADQLFAAQYGADGVAFVNQGTQYRLFDQMDTVVGSNMVSEPLFASLGDKVIGFYNDVRYSPLIDTPENKKFVEAWRAKRSEDLYYLTGGNYNAMQILFQGIEKAGSSDPDAVREALSGAEVSTLYGPATIRPEDQQLLIPTYLGQVAQDAGGELHFRLAATVPASKTTPSPSPLCDIDAEAA
jgi:ABC-type branched-subunit amino acid transport system substrate-binding protein